MLCCCAGQASSTPSAALTASRPSQPSRPCSRMAAALPRRQCPWRHRPCRHRPHRTRSRGGPRRVAACRRAAEGRAAVRRAPSPRGRPTAARVGGSGRVHLHGVVWLKSVWVGEGRSAEGEGGGDAIQQCKRAGCRFSRFKLPVGVSPYGFRFTSLAFFCQRAGLRSVRDSWSRPSRTEPGARQPHWGSTSMPS